MGVILHQNSKGIKMIRDDFRFRSRVRVISEVEGKQYTLHTYRFDNIHESIDLPYNSWANLDCCGGWSYDGEYLDTAVQHGAKLFAGRSMPLRDPYTPNAPTLEDAQRQFEEFKETLPAGVFADVEHTDHSSGCFHTFICRTGKLSDHVDLDTVFSFYDKLGEGISPSEQKEVERYCGFEIKQFGTDHAPFRYVTPSSKTGLITTGLLLGYPIESTVSILQGY